MWLWRSTLLFCLLFLSSCGYTLSHRLKDQFGDKRGIFVPVFTNRTEQIGAERSFTNALIRELLTHGEVVMSSREAGGLELLGTLTEIDARPTTLSDTTAAFGGLATFKRIPTEMGVRVTINLALNDIKTGANIWSREFTGFRRLEAPISRTFNREAPSALAPLTQSLVEAKFDVLAVDVVREIYDDMVALF